MSDFAKFDRPAQLHLGYQALDQFACKEGRLPLPYNQADATKFTALAKEINGSAANKVGGASTVVGLPYSQADATKFTARSLMAVFPFWIPQHCCI